MVASAKAVHYDAQQAERSAGAEYYRAEIDGLRGVAVLAVIAFHAFPEQFPGGFVGVDVFFVISGFLISSIILRELHRSTFTLTQFYARRIRRIFPSLVIVSSASLLVGAFVLLPDELEALGKHVAAAALFLSNLTLWQESGYFDRASDLKPLLHLWSLGVEEQFYLVWPISLLLLWKIQRHNLVRHIVGLTAGSFVLALSMAVVSPTANFYLPLSRFWELGLGCLLAIVQRGSAQMRRGRDDDASARSSHAHSILGIVGSGLIALAVFGFDRDTTHPGWATLVPTIGTICVICAGASAWFQRRVMASAALVAMGLVSYPLYLWHWPILSFATILGSGTPDVGTRVVAILLSLGLAWLTYRFLERPIRTRHRPRDAAALAAALLMLGAVGFAMHSARGFPNRFEFDVRAIQPEPRTNSLCLRRFPDNPGFNYCKSTGAAAPSIVFLGDSRAQAVYDAVVDLTNARDSFTLLARGGCPPLLGVELHFMGESGCTEVWDAFVEYVAEEKPATVVLIGGGAELLNATVADLDSDDFDTREAAFRHGLRELILTLQRTSRVFYVLEFPRFPSSPSCFLRRIKIPGPPCAPTIERKAIETGTSTYRRLVHELRAELPELRVIESLPTLCDETRCSQKLASGEIIYSDTLHLSPAGGRYFAQNSGLVRMLFDDSGYDGDKTD